LPFVPVRRSPATSALGRGVDRVAAAALRIRKDGEMKLHLVAMLALVLGLSVTVAQSASAETWSTIADGTYVDGVLTLRFDPPALLTYHYLDNALRRKRGLPPLSLRERKAQVYEEGRSMLDAMFPDGNVPPTLSAKIKMIKAGNEAGNDAQALAVGISKSR
jgi:hypothetical protein